MTQTATLLTSTGSIAVELPSPVTRVLGGVCWGSVDAFPMPAYWRFQVVARRLSGRPAAYKLGRTLAEEVGACLLGGHGIPATVGLAAYERLRQAGAFAKSPTQEQLADLLRQPLDVGGRQVRYRFAAQKADYLAKALPLALQAPCIQVGRQLRDWLMELPGVGPKTASWIARNWLDADDVAILDIHIMRVGQLIGLFQPGLTVERHYLELERLFLEFSAAIDVRPSELDTVIWSEMASSPVSVRFVVDELSKGAHANNRSVRRKSPHRQTELKLAA